MGPENLRLDPVLQDFHEPFTPPKRMDVEVVLMELLENGLLPKAYTVNPSDYVLLGEVQELERGSKTIFLKDGTRVFYSYLIIISKANGQKEEFDKAVQSLIEAISVNKKVGLQDKIPQEKIESVHKLRSMTKKPGLQPLEMIKNVNHETRTREPQNRLFELHL